MRRLGFAVLLLLAGGWEALRAADADVERGNQAFREGRYDDALGHYRAAEARGGDSRLHFDMGTALYKLAEKSADEGKKAKLFEQAEEEFRRAADTDDVRLKSSAYYNLGNSMYQRRQWEDAIASYKRALRADPGNEPARHNLEMALRQREKHEQQRGGQGKQDPKKGQEGQNQDQQQQGGKQGADGEPEKPQDQDQQRQGAEGKDQEPPQQPPPQPQGQEDQQQPQGQQDQPAGPDQQPGQQDQEREQPQAGGQEPDQAPAGEDESMSGTPSDQERKLEELERRSRDLRKRLLRQGSRNRDPLRLPSRKDW